MTKPPARKPTARRAPRPKAMKAPAPTPPKRSPEERKAKVIELMLLAVAGGWSLRKFSRRSGVSIRTLMRYVAEPTVQPRYLQAMQIKAITLPDEAMELVQILKAGGQVITIPGDAPGTFRQVWQEADPKALGVAIRHLEFRMMREIKALYQPTKEVRNITTPSDMPDDQLDNRINELVERALNARS